MKPFLSIIIPAYNEAENFKNGLLNPAFQYLQKVKYSYEVIIVNDGSTDDTSEVLEKTFPGEPRLRVIDRPNMGKWAALNHGLELATSDIVVTLDADTLFEPHCIEELIRPLVDPAIAASAGNATAPGSRPPPRRPCRGSLWRAG